MLRDKGWTIPQIAESLLISDDAISQHITDYREAKKLKPEGGGSAEQSCQLEEHLQKYTYLFVKDIAAYVKSNWNIVYTIHGLRNWLKRHGFSYKKPAVVPDKANEEQQRAWIAEYEKLKQNLPLDETICFMDGVHPTHNTQPAYGWIKFEDPLGMYRRRWEIETMFGCLKTRGFRMEETHIPDPDKIEKVVFVLAIAFCWAYRMGNIQDHIQRWVLRKFRQLLLCFTCLEPAGYAL